MRSLSLIIIGLTVVLNSLFPIEDIRKINLAQPQKSPHGDNFKVRCINCHTPEGWKVDRQHLAFNHDSTAMPLIGEHVQIDCKLCHPTLIFTDASTECVKCHTDIHESTVGKECSRCHTTYSWLVNNITQIHQQSRFPLVGLHATVDCDQCHPSETLQLYEVLGTECYSCHMKDYAATTQPNHATAGFSTKCDECHTIFAKEFKGAGFNHTSFPLTLGHDIDECSKCHTNEIYTNTSRECISCHQADYKAATNPNHVRAKFSTDCSTCHTTTPSWKPAKFDHSMFPLTQGHDIDDCSKCHLGGNYNLPSGDCINCHRNDFNAATNPNHVSAGYSTNCSACHTTTPGWKPAKFDHSMFPLTQGHDIDDCTRCHPAGSNYSTT